MHQEEGQNSTGTRNNNNDPVPALYPLFNDVRRLFDPQIQGPVRLKLARAVSSLSCANSYFPNRNNDLALLYRASAKIAGMLEIIELLTHCFITLIKLLKPGGVKVVMAKSIAVKHQLIVMNRARKRSPALVTRDRFLFGSLAILIGERRLQKVAVILKPTTILAFHLALVKRKYSKLHSNQAQKIQG